MKSFEKKEDDQGLGFCCCYVVRGYVNLDERSACIAC